MSQENLPTNPQIEKMKTTFQIPSEYTDDTHTVIAEKKQFNPPSKWRGLDRFLEIANEAKFAKLKSDKQPDQKNSTLNPIENPTGISRRRFLKVLGGAAAVAIGIKGEQEFIDLAKNIKPNGKKLKPIIPAIGDKLGNALADGAKNFNEGSEEFGKSIYENAKKIVEDIGSKQEITRFKRLQKQIAQINNRNR